MKKTRKARLGGMCELNCFVFVCIPSLYFYLASNELKLIEKFGIKEEVENAQQQLLA